MSFTPKSVFASLPKTERGRALVINGDPKGKNFLYTNEKTVIIRNLANPEIGETYSQHSVDATVARYAPSGFYIASADISGKVRIWDTTQAEHILKYEYPCIGGPIKDLQWSPDSKRIVVVGEGRENFGRVFLWDSGSSVGTVMGHSKVINTCDYKPTRPFRLVTGADDFQVAFSHGPPFKLDHNIRDHTRFVNSVRYSPDGERFCSAAADGKIFVYDGKTGEKVAELADGGNAHKGGVYAISWSADSSRLLSASGDKSCKIWDVAAGSVVTQFEMGTRVEDQQLGCLWQGDFLVSVSLSGCINYLDPNSGKTSRVVQGHLKTITSMATSPDKSQFFTGSYDSSALRWSTDGNAQKVGGSGHTNQVTQMAATSSRVVSCGMDDTVRFMATQGEDGASYGGSLKMASVPGGVAANDDGLVIVACQKEVVVIRDEQQRSTLPASSDYSPTCAAIHPNGSEVAVGGSDNKIRVYTVSGDDTLTEKAECELRGEITQLAYSSDGVHLAASTAAREVAVLDTSTYKTRMLPWSNHTAKVTSVAWAPDNDHLASGSIDSHVYVWSVSKPDTRVHVARAHPLGTVTQVGWLDNTTVMSTGSDNCVRTFNITHH